MAICPPAERPAKPALVFGAPLPAPPTGRWQFRVYYGDYTDNRPVATLDYLIEHDGDRYRRWIKMALEEGIHDTPTMVRAITEMSQYFAGELKKRGTAPGDDLICLMRDQRVDGEPLSPEKLIGTLRLILIAGIDTTWSAIGASLWHLATHPEDARRLATEPALMDTAVEELLRAYAPVTMAREVKKDVVVNGCPMKAGSMVLLSFPAANRDPEMFPDADKVILDRQENRHAAFGLGIHRCAGSNLARMELRVALEEWLRRILEFRLSSGAMVTWSEGTVRGPRQLPVTFGKG